MCLAQGPQRSDAGEAWTRGLSVRVIFWLSVYIFTLNLIEMAPFNTSANIADPDQVALVRAAWSGSTLFAYGNMTSYDPTLMDLTSNFFVVGA